MQLTCPVLFITGYPTIETATEALRLGACDYLLKPVRKDHLVQVTHRTLQQHHTQEQQARHHSYLEAVVDTVEAAIIAVNTALIVVDLNRTGQQWCGGAQALGQPLGALFQGGAERCIQALHNAITGRHRVDVQRFEWQHGQQPKRLVSLTPRRCLMPGAWSLGRS
jgi:two-component system, NtrC family, response regulator HydG